MDGVGSRERGNGRWGRTVAGYVYVQATDVTREIKDGVLRSEILNLWHACTSKSEVHPGGVQRSSYSGKTRREVEPHAPTADTHQQGEVRTDIQQGCTTGLYRAGALDRLYSGIDISTT
jgi:hypothetical protein